MANYMCDTRKKGEEDNLSYWNDMIMIMLRLNWYLFKYNLPKLTKGN